VLHNPVREEYTPPHGHGLGKTKETVRQLASMIALNFTRSKGMTIYDGTRVSLSLGRFPAQGKVYSNSKSRANLMIKLARQGGTCDMLMVYMKEAGKLPILEEAAHSRIGSLRRPSGNRSAVHVLHGPWQNKRRREGTVGN